MRKWYFGPRYLLVACLALVLGGCAGTQTATTSQIAKAEKAPTKSEYLIGAGDSLEIYVRNNPDLTVTVPVRPDGRISTPMVQDMRAVGKTPTQLANDIKKVLSTYIRNPFVTVIVKNFVGAYSEQVRIVGQAAKPQAIPYRDGMTVLDVMIDVGGLTKFAAGNRAKLIRREGKKEVTIPLRLDDLLNKGEMSANMPIHPGDTIIIPESLF